MKIFSVFLIFILSIQTCFASALPVSNMQNAVSGVMQAKIKQKGFAANDPRYGATLDAASNGLSAAAGAGAAAIVVGSVTAPAWFTVALAAGVSAVVTYAVSLGIDSLSKWLFGTDKITIEPVVSGQLIQGHSYWSADSYSSYEVIGSDPMSVLNYAFTANYARKYADSRYSYFVKWDSCIYEPSLVRWTCQVYKYETTQDPSTAVFDYKYEHALYRDAQSSVTCPTGQVYYQSVCQPATNPLQQQDLTPQQAYDSVPESDKSKALSPEIIAALANKAWQNAASQPNYDGVPYSPNDPITKEDVERWKQDHPTYYPTVDDFIKPQLPANQPFILPKEEIPASTQNPETQTNNNTNPNAGQPKIDLGPDPNIGAPQLEATPTAQDIINPIKNLMPSLNNYHANIPAGSCPNFSFDFFGDQVGSTAHCQLIDDNKPLLQQMAVIGYAIAALFIILSA